MSRRIPSLDGLRAISILMVLLGHVKGTVGFPFPWVPFAWGSLGVTVFFVISGYLITALLVKEHARTGTVSLGAFYVRRTIRIFPALYVFAGVVVLLEMLSVLELLPGDALAATTYTMNFRAVRAWWLGHTWSLGVEEQFYLLWPATVAILGVAGGLRVAIGAIVAAPLLRVAVFYGWPAHRALVDQAFPLIFDGLATGCTLAILRERLWAWAPYRRLLESRLFAAVPALVVVTYLYSPSVGASLLAGQTLIHFGIAMSIDWAIRFPDSTPGRMLNTRPAIWIGTISYSLYLWQQLFLCRFQHAWYTTFPLNVALAFAAATASYLLVERPLVQLRARFAPDAPRAAAVARATSISIRPDLR